MIKRLSIAPLLWSAAVSLCACAQLQQAPSSPDTFAACKAADAATTLKIIGHGGTELNPIASVFLHAGHVPFLLAEAGIAWLVWHYSDRLTEEQRVAVNVIGCAPAVHNVIQLVN